MATKLDSIYYSAEDASLKETDAIPAAAATGYTTAIEIDKGVRHWEHYFSIPATPDLVEAKTIICTLQLGDGSSYADTDTTLTVTGAAQAAGGAADSWQVALTDTEDTYCRVKMVVLTGAGDNTGVDVTTALRFAG